jgi:ribosomal protein S12 methylthiotransferase accessory factor YcaO
VPIIPQLTLAGAPVTVCSLPELGRRRIAALYRAGAAQSARATNAVLNALAEAGQAKASIVTTTAMPNKPESSDDVMKDPPA